VLSYAQLPLGRGGRRGRSHGRMCRHSLARQEKDTERKKKELRYKERHFFGGKGKSLLGGTKEGISPLHC